MVYWSFVDWYVHFWYWITTTIHHNTALTQLQEQQLKKWKMYGQKKIARHKFTNIGKYHEFTLFPTIYDFVKSSRNVKTFGFNLKVLCVLPTMRNFFFSNKCASLPCTTKVDSIDSDYSIRLDKNYSAKTAQRTQIQNRIKILKKRP